jgi:hypothetical protein
MATPERSHHIGARRMKIGVSRVRVNIYRRRYPDECADLRQENHSTVCRGHNPNICIDQYSTRYILTFIVIGLSFSHS